MTKNQLEIHWAEPEAFTLTVQTTQDGDRVAADLAQSATDRQAADQLQTTFPEGQGVS